MAAAVGRYVIDDEPAATPGRYVIDDESVPTTSTATERALALPGSRAILGALDLPKIAVQLSANVGEKLADLTGITGKFGKTEFIPMSSVPEDRHQAIVEQGMTGRGEVPGGIDAGTINAGIAELEAMKRRGMAARSGNPVGEDWDIAGTMGSLIPGVGVYKGISSLLPKAVSETAPKLMGRIAGRAATGAGTSALTVPDISGGEDYFGDLAIKGGLGALLNVATPAVISSVKGLGKIGGQAGRAARDTLRNFTDKGTTKLTEAHLRDLGAKGGDPALKKTIGSLLNEKGIISPPTSADAIAAGNIGKPERFGGPLVRLQAELGSLPETTTRLQSFKVAQEEARKTALDKISGTPAEREAAEKALEKASAAYEAIKSTLVKSDPVLDRLSASPAFRGAEKYAEENIANSNAARAANGLPPVPFKQEIEVGGKKVIQYSADGLQQIKQALDEMTMNPTLASGLGVTGTEKAHIKPVKDTLINWMNTKVKGWEFARESYRDAKVVQNRQKAGGVLKDVLTSAKDEERVGPWLQAQRNLPETLKTKMKQGKAYPVEFLPEQQKILDNITRELERDAKVAQMTREVNIPGATTVVSGKQAQLPRLLYRPTVVANWFLRQSTEEGNETVNRKAAEILASPEKLAEILSKTDPKWHGQIKKAMLNFERYATSAAGRTAAIQGISRTNE